MASAPVAPEAIASWTLKVSAAGAFDPCSNYGIQN